MPSVTESLAAELQVNAPTVGHTLDQEISPAFNAAFVSPSQDASTEPCGSLSIAMHSWNAFAVE
jgi:hypothetical protein